MFSSIGIRSLFTGALVVALSAAAAVAQTPTDRIVGAINDAQTVTLRGNVHPLASAAYDRGLVSPETRMDRMMLLLKSSAEQQAALDALVAAQHDPQSPEFHKWLTPAEYADRFGVSDQDLARITGWLEENGFQVEEIPASNRLIIFSGNAGQVAAAFHTEIHQYDVKGAMHIANAQDPQIPAALADVVESVVSMHNFRRDSQISSRRELGAHPQWTSGGTNYIFPGDWATIYDVNPLYTAGKNGSGVSIAIVGRSNINVSDVTLFRSTAGLVANNPQVILVSGNPGLVSGDQDESTLDVEWSGAVAPSATVKFVVGESTNSSDGVDLSAQYIVNHATAPVVSTSYGSCEAYMGSGELSFYNSLWQQGASEGISSFVSSGDSGASGCDGGSSSSGSGRAVNGSAAPRTPHASVAPSSTKVQIHRNTGPPPTARQKSRH